MQDAIDIFNIHKQIMDDYQQFYPHQICLNFIPTGIWPRRVFCPAIISPGFPYAPISLSAIPENTSRGPNDEAAFLNIRYLPCAQLVQINNKWWRSKEDGFLMGLKSCAWKKEKYDHPAETAEPVRRVKLVTHDTADALYIEPIKALALERSGVITLQYALKRAVENVFQVEPNEIGAELMGNDETPNIFLYESAEGSLGVLSQFIENKDVFHQVVAEAIHLCRYEDETYTDEASYTDLLSYYNQRYHNEINRFAIKEAMETLSCCHVEIITNKAFGDYDGHYQRILAGIDPHSSGQAGFDCHET